MAKSRDLEYRKESCDFESFHLTLQTQFFPQKAFERFLFQLWKIASSEIPYFIEIFELFAMNKDPLETELES